MVLRVAVFFGCLFVCHRVSASTNFTAGNCLEGIQCEHCPDRKILQNNFGNAFCCAGCDKAPIFGVRNGHCLCINDSPPINEKLSSRIIFQGMHKQSKESSNRKNMLNRVSALKTPNYETEYLNRAIGLMADAIEKIDLRLRRIEETLAQVNLLKYIDIPISQQDLNAEKRISSFSKCKENFVEVENYCIFPSVFDNQRANWEIAQKTCKKLGANLAEVSTHSYFTKLSSYLASTPSTAGYSYWIGAVYPGETWIWTLSGQNVTMNSSYWTQMRPFGRRWVLPSKVAGNTKNGRCLSFQFLTEQRGYSLAGDQCVYEKFFICQMDKK